MPKSTPHKSYFEVNFDGLIGPTHNYSGLSLGNIASILHAAKSANPKAAALQGLEKMKLLLDLGLKQAILPPHERPHIPTLRKMGFTGTNKQILEKCAKTNPHLLLTVSSASPMWTANAATVSPSLDCQDGKLHITVANLNHKVHRAFEHETTQKILEAIFSHQDYFTIHPALDTNQFGDDEGSANHTRLCAHHGQPGLEFFVFGKYQFKKNQHRPKTFSARQSFEAQDAIAKIHGLNPAQTVFAQQNPDAIDKGVFHNDVISVGNENVMLFHESAFLDASNVIKSIKDKFSKMSTQELCLISITNKDVPLDDAIHTYLFNSQLVTLDKNKMALIAPQECEDNKTIYHYINDLLQDHKNPIQSVKYVDLTQSMQNGGGPACLRLRVVMSDLELKNMNKSVLLDHHTIKVLTEWVKKHYRDKLNPSDLSDAKLLIESQSALDELTQILHLGSLYDFQNP